MSVSDVFSPATMALAVHLNPHREAAKTPGTMHDIVTAGLLCGLGANAQLVQSTPAGGDHPSPSESDGSPSSVGASSEDVARLLTFDNARAASAARDLERADAEDEEDDMSNAEPSSARTRDSGFRGGRGARGADAAAAPLAGGLAKKAGANAERRFSSKFYGVSWHKSSGRWAVQIRHGGKRIHVGYYSLEGDAARAYDDTARRLRGGGTKTNFSEDGACLVHGAGGGDGSEGETAGSGGARDRTASWPTDTADGGVAEPAHATTEACTAVVSVRSAPPPGSSPGKPRPPARKRPRPLAEASGGGGGAYDSTGGSSVRSGASDDGMPAAAAAPLGAWALAGVSSEAQCTAAAVAFFKRERTAAAPIAWRAAIIRPRARGGVRCVEHAIFA